MDGEDGYDNDKGSSLNRQQKKRVVLLSKLCHWSLLYAEDIEGWCEKFSTIPRECTDLKQTRLDRYTGGRGKWLVD